MAPDEIKNDFEWLIRFTLDFFIKKPPYVRLNQAGLLRLFVANLVQILLLA